MILVLNPDILESVAFLEIQNWGRDYRGKRA